MDCKVSLFQINLSCGFKNKLLSNDLIIDRNYLDDEEDVGGGVWRSGGPARASKPSWRPNPSRARVCLGVQDQPALKSMPRSDMEFKRDILHMYGKVRR